jgi:hypothetical protein
MKGFSSKLVVVLFCCLALFSFVAGQNTSNDARSRSLRGFNEELQEGIMSDFEEEKRLLKKVGIHPCRV